MQHDSPAFKPSLIIVWAPLRTASTWLCNALLDGLQRSGKVGGIFYWGNPSTIAELKKLPQNRAFTILKCHDELTPDFLDLLSVLFDVKVFTTLRSGESIAQSWSRTSASKPYGVLERNVRIVNNIVSSLRRDWNIAIVEEAEARYAADSLYERIFTHAGIHLSVEDLNAVVQQNSLKANMGKVAQVTRNFDSFDRGHDSKTTWHKDHISDSLYEERKWDRATNALIHTLDVSMDELRATAHLTSGDRIPQTPEQWLLEVTLLKKKRTLTFRIQRKAQRWTEYLKNFFRG